MQDRERKANNQSGKVLRKIFSPEDITENVEICFVSNSIINNYSEHKEHNFQTTVNRTTDGCLPIKIVENTEPEFKENGKVFSSMNIMKIQKQSIFCLIFVNENLISAN